jgi:hypothetical protein
MHLYICRESLNVASKHHSRVFGINHSFLEVYFDFERDTLYFDWRGSFSLDDSSKEDLKRVKYLPVEMRAVEMHGPSAALLVRFLAEVLGHSPNLKKITLSTIRGFYAVEESGELVFVRPGEGIWRFYMLFSEYLVYGSEEEENEDEEIRKEEVEEAQINEDKEESEDEEGWEAKRQEWGEYFRHRDLAKWFKGKHYQTDEYKGLVELFKKHVRTTIGFFGSRELEPCWVWLEDCKLVRSMPKIDCQINSTPTIKDQLLSLEADIAEAMEG